MACIKKIIWNWCRNYYTILSHYYRGTKNCSHRACYNWTHSFTDTDWRRQYLWLLWILLPQPLELNTVRISTLTHFQPLNKQQRTSNNTSPSLHNHYLISITEHGCLFQAYSRILILWICLQTNISYSLHLSRFSPELFNSLLQHSTSQGCLRMQHSLTLSSSPVGSWQSQMFT